MKSVVLAGVVLLLGACGGGYSERPAWRRLGNEMYAVNCLALGTCYARAAYVCQFGFDVLDGASEQSGARATSKKIGSTVVTNVENGEVTRQLVVRCQAPQFCAQQSDCKYGSKCVRTERYPDNPACSIR